MSTKQRFASVWDAIEDTPQEAASLRARSALMMSITEAIKTQGLTQVQAAELFGVTQPRISDLVRGKANLFSLDALVEMASTAGMAPTIKVTMPKRPVPVQRTTARKLTAGRPSASARAALKTAA